MNTKYKLTQNTKDWFGTTLYQIEALVSFGSVSKGELGGYIEKEENLSVSGNAWVDGNAWVFGDARVSGNARVYGNASVFGNAWVFGDARVFGDAWVFGDARVSGNAWVDGNAWVYGNASVFGKLKLEAGFFFGVKWKSDTEIKQVEIEDGNYLVYKGDAKFGVEETEPSLTGKEVSVTLDGKTYKAIIQ